MKHVDQKELVSNKYYIIYFKPKWCIVKYVKNIELYSFRGNTVSLNIVEHLNGISEGRSLNLYEWFELSVDEINNHILMEYI